MSYQIERARFHLAEHYQQQYVAVVPRGTDPKELEDPQFFATVANQCRAAGRIWVECEDGTWVADLYIQGVGPQFVMAKVLAVHQLGPVSEPKQTPPGYEVQWAGVHHKFRVVRKSDDAVVHKGEDTKSGAERWLAEHLKAVEA